MRKVQRAVDDLVQRGRQDQRQHAGFVCSGLIFGQIRKDQPPLRRSHNLMICMAPQRISLLVLEDLEAAPLKCGVHVKGCHCSVKDFLQNLPLF